jgi:hypothetical protein
LFLSSFSVVAASFVVELSDDLVEVDVLPVVVVAGRVVVEVGRVAGLPVSGRVVLLPGFVSFDPGCDGWDGFTGWV